jgi:uncharacterized protein (TIGR00369 family)
MSALAATTTDTGPAAGPPHLATGLDLMRAIVEGTVEPPGFAVLLGLQALEVEEGRMVFGLAPRPDLLNPMGTLHGGVIATLLDTAMGTALHTTLPLTSGYTTLQLNVHYLRAPRAGDPPVHAVGQLVHRGRRTATAEARLVRADDGTLLAHATSHLLILDGAG